MLMKILICAALATVAMFGAAGAQQLPAATQQTATIKRTPSRPSACAEKVAGDVRTVNVA